MTPETIHLRIGLAIALALATIACDKPPTAARAALRETHVPDVIAAVREDIARQRAGIAVAAERLSGGFIIEDPVRREKDLRFALRYLQEPPRGIPEYVASPMSFLAAVGPDGRVIARDMKKQADDKMRGDDFAKKFAVVRNALAGRAGEELVAFSTEAEKEASFSFVFAQPVWRDGAIVGVLVSGIPLWRWAQRLSKQGQLELAKEPGHVYWVFAYKDERVFPPQEGIDLTSVLPSAAERKAKLDGSARAYSSVLQQFGRGYAYAVVPVPSIAPDVGFLIVRGEPTR